MLSEGKTVTEVAVKFRVSRQTIYIKGYRRERVRELRDAYQRKQAMDKDSAGETRH